MHALRAAAAAAGAMTALAGRPHAGPDAHQTGDEARIVVDAAGAASVEHALRWRVARGPLRWLDVLGVDPSAVVDTAVDVVRDDGSRQTALAERVAPDVVRVRFDDVDPPARGGIGVTLRWRVDLVAARALTRDVSGWRLVLSAPVAADGFDSARTWIDLASAPQGPLVISPENGAVDDGAVQTLRRGPDRDVLELFRPHVSRGESVTWTLRVDPRALPLAAGAAGRGASPASVPASLGPGGDGAWLTRRPDGASQGSPGAAWTAAAVALGTALALLVAHKARTFAAACAERGGRAVGLLPLPVAGRALLAGASLAAAAALERGGRASEAGALVALAVLAAAVRPASGAPRARGPGRWVALRADDAFAAHGGPGHWLDVSSGAGRRTALGAAVATGAAFWLLHRVDVTAAWSLVLDAATLVPLLATGTRVQLPPDGARSSARWLRGTFERLTTSPRLRVVPWARVGVDGARADELRLLVLPEPAMPGVVGVEVGVAWSSTPACWAGTPEVLARVLDGSAAALRLVRELPGARSVVGRRADERVIRLLPRAPTGGATVQLVRALVDALVDRRAAPPAPWAAPERRGPATPASPAQRAQAAA